MNIIKNILSKVIFKTPSPLGRAGVGPCLVLVAGLLASCADMDYHEYKVDGKDYITEKFSNVYGFMTTIYKYLDSDFGAYSGACLASATDEAVYSHQGNQIESFYNGAWGPSNANSSEWSNCWDGIAYCNLFLDEFNNLTFDDYKLDVNYKAEMEKYNNFQWEVRFIRAYCYFRLLRQYGGVPLITKNLNAEEANNTPRATAEEIFKFIDDECVAIKDTIIKDYSKAYSELGLAETGRANDLAVLALRARAALYHASPLFNPNNDKSLWKEAALRAQECLNACSSRNMGLTSKYETLFATDSYKDTKEIIFGTRNAKANAFEKYNFPIGMENAGGGNCPTQNLVDAYEMTNGKAITDPESGYDPQDPYKNRDARLAATVAVNGERWPDALPTDVLETYYGGANSRSIAYGTPTGYYLKKYMQKQQVIGASNATTSFHTWVIFRVAEMQLNYAEAVMNYFGDGYATGEGFSRSAAQAINVVRKRAGQPDLPTGLSFDQFKQRYENERFVEFAFEGHRFYDVRRWMEGAKYFKDIKVMEITKTTTEEGDKFTYTPVTNPSYITARQWNDKFNLFPIPQSEILKSGALTQTQGWE